MQIRRTRERHARNKNRHRHRRQPRHRPQHGSCPRAKGVASILTYKSNAAEADKVIALAKDVGAEAVALQLDVGLVGLPNDIGTVIANVLSDEMGWINAQRVEASGGVHI